MVILLEGTSDLARAAVAEQVTELHPEWKHLALEVIAEVAGRGDDADRSERQQFSLEVVKRCAEELSQSGLHMILSMPAMPDQAMALQDMLAPECIAVCLGDTAAADRYDYVLDTSVQSVKDIVTFLDTLIEGLSEELT